MQGAELGEKSGRLQKRIMNSVPCLISDTSFYSSPTSYSHFLQMIMLYFCNPIFFLKLNVQEVYYFSKTKKYWEQGTQLMCISDEICLQTNTSNKPAAHAQKEFLNITVSQLCDFSQFSWLGVKSWDLYVKKWNVCILTYFTVILSCFTHILILV